MQSHNGPSEEYRVGWNSGHAQCVVPVDSGHSAATVHHDYKAVATGTIRYSPSDRTIPDARPDVLAVDQGALWADFFRQPNRYNDARFGISIFACSGKR